jgi:exonuclease III
LSSGPKTVNLSIFPQKIKKTDLKVNALCKKNCDVIFLSDVRLNSVKQTHAVFDLGKKLESTGYTSFFHSPQSSRGVGILISKKVDFVSNSTILKDEIGNYMILPVKINNKPVTLCAVYGPNSNDISFFDNLETALNHKENIIIGGDFNCTWDPRSNLDNLDTLNMVQIPSRIRSERLNTMSTNLCLHDPFRIFNPVAREFTYVPNAHRNVNRSRIDFFFMFRDSHSYTTKMLDRTKCNQFTFRS